MILNKEFPFLMLLPKIIINLHEQHFIEMKIKLIILIVFSSQIIFSQGFSGGLLGGLIVSQVDGDAYDGYRKFGIQAGAYSSYSFNDKWGFTMEFKYIQKGSSKTDKKDPYSDFKIKLNYIDIPVLLNYNYNEKLIFGTGLSYGLLVNAEVQDGAGVVPEEYLSYHDYDINAIIQVKYFLNEYFWVDLKGAYSAIYINDSHPKQSNNLFSMSLGYQF